MSGKGWQLQVLNVLERYLSLIHCSKRSMFSSVGGNGHSFGGAGGSSLVGHEHLPDSRPVHVLDSFSVDSVMLSLLANCF